MSKLSLSVELEPPKGIHDINAERTHTIENEIDAYLPYVEMVSITNRPVFGLSAITFGKQIFNYVYPKKKTRVCIHLTTRLSHYDLFRSVLDAQRIGLTDVMPILGDPRGPKDPSYFDDGFEIIGFTSYLKYGDTKYLSKRYQEMLQRGQLVEPIKNPTFSIGSVIDVNRYKLLPNKKEVDIREKQIRFAQKKEEMGAEYLVSQGLYNPQDYFEFVDEAKLGIPIIAGILPARVRLLDMFGMVIDPLDKQRLRAQFTSIEEREEGNKIAKRVYNELLDGGCNKFHIYSLGNSENFLSIVNGSSLEPVKLPEDQYSQIKE